MLKDLKLNLRLFDDGAGDTGATSAAAGQDTGVNDAAAERERWRQLGVPENKMPKSRIKAQRPNQQQPNTTQGAVVPAEVEAQAQPTEQTNTDNNAPAYNWDEIKNDPTINAEIQKIVAARVNKANTALQAADDRYNNLLPALEVLSQKYGLDPANIDPDALSKAIVDDDSLFEDRAMELGVSVDVARKLDRYDKMERQAAEERRQQGERAQYEQHFQNLQQQAETMKQAFPGFDLMAELQNQEFARLTAPNGVSVQAAYYALHHDEIMRAGMQQAEEKGIEAATNAVRANQSRPRENGISSRHTATTKTPYNKLSRAEQQAIIKDMQARTRRGEKAYL